MAQARFRFHVQDQVSALGTGKGMTKVGPGNYATFEGGRDRETISNSRELRFTEGMQVVEQLLLGQLHLASPQLSDSKLCCTPLSAEPAEPAMRRTPLTNILDHLLSNFPHVHFPRNLLSFPFTTR
jgi:hypothetical protein